LCCSEPNTLFYHEFIVAMNQARRQGGASC
jgi:hypothetical protein